MRSSCVAHERAVFCCVTEYGHSQAVSMWQLESGASAYHIEYTRIWGEHGKNDSLPDPPHEAPPLLTLAVGPVVHIRAAVDGVPVFSLEEENGLVSGRENE
jgi:hypothetical protein